MKIPVAKNLFVQIEQPKGTGSTWVVRVFRRKFPFKKLISSDWFLDEEQARSFAQQLADALTNGADPMMLKERKPGWTTFDSLPKVRQTT